jgi:hypothetical protein
VRNISTHSEIRDLGPCFHPGIDKLSSLLANRSPNLSMTRGVYVIFDVPDIDVFAEVAAAACNNVLVLVFGPFNTYHRTMPRVAAASSNEE